MANSVKQKGRPVVLGVYQFVPEIYRRIFTHCSPPFNVTKADSVFTWSSEEKLAFDILRDKITSAPILTLPDNSRPYHVEADSLDFATRAVLSQENHKDGKWHPLAFLSKSLSPVERNYKIHDK